MPVADFVTERLKRTSIRQMVEGIDHAEMVSEILNGVGDTDSRGLRMVQYAMKLLELHCRGSAEVAPAIRFEKMDLGSDKSFSNLQAVSDERLGNVFAFNAGGQRENPDGVWRISYHGAGGTPAVRGLVVEIDGDDGKASQPRVTATKMWEHLMYSKLVAGGGRKGMHTNGFTMRIHLARTEVDDGDEDQKKSYRAWKKNPAGWHAEAGNAQFQVTQCIRALHALTGSVVHSIRDIIMCMAQKDCVLYKASELNNFHVNIFIGPFKLNIPDNTGRTAQAIPTPVAVNGKYSKSEFRLTDDWTKNLMWEIEFKLLCANTFGATKVQYLLVENFTGHMAAPENKVANNTGTGVWVSKKTVTKKNDHYYNRGLMSLLDILYTPELYMMNPGPTGPAVAFPNWKRGNYIKSKSKKRQTGYREFFQILNNVCRLMENFLLYQLKDSIIWEKDKTWPMREWMVNIAHTLNISPGRLQPTTRASMLMTPDHSVESPNSLSARLRSSLRITLPQLDESVMEYLKLNGFDNIRDSELYLRLVGVTNYLALQELARTHETLLGSSELHARVFNGLSLGTQSEMKLMFQRITMRPDTVHDAMSRLDINSPLPAPKRHSNIMTHAVGKDLIRRLVDATIVEKHGDLNVWKDDEHHVYENDIIQYIITNAKYFLTSGIYKLARSWPYTLEVPLLDETYYSQANTTRTEIQKIIDAAKTNQDDTHKTFNFLNTDGKPNQQRCEYMLHLETQDYFDKYSATFDDVKDDDTYDTSIDAEEINRQLENKKAWCKEFLLGFIRLHQFIHVLIDTETPNAKRETFKLYLRGYESYTDAEIVEFGADTLSREIEMDNMKKQNLVNFTEKMLLYTWSFAFVIHDNGTINVIPETVAELKTITTNDSNIMTEWLKDVDVVRTERKQLKEAVDRKTRMNPLNNNYKTTTKEVDDKRKSTQEAEYKYKTTNAFVLFEQYYDFKKKAVLYGEEEDRLPRIKHDDTRLYDDSDVSTESSSDDNL